MDKFQDFDIYKDRADELLFEKMATDYRFVGLILLPHGQASVERGSSINSKIEETKLKTEFFTSERLICDFVYSVDELFNVNIDKSLLKAVSFSNILSLILNLLKKMLINLQKDLKKNQVSR